MDASSWTLPQDPPRGSQTHLTPRLGATAPVMVTFVPSHAPPALRERSWPPRAVVSQLGLGTSQWVGGGDSRGHRAPGSGL